MFSLRTVIDDILLLVRNNNISESEDLSRAQIAHWVLAYRAALLKKEKDADESKGEDDEFEEGTSKTIGPVELEQVKSLDQYPTFTRVIKDKIEDLLDNDPDNIIAVYDQENCVIQAMNQFRRHLHYFRKYTNQELTYDYDDGYVYIRGCEDCNRLKYVYIKYIASGENEDDEDEINIPGWMIPDIKQMIMKNELAFMTQMPSDDDNNATLDGIKPNGSRNIPKDAEK